MTLAQARGHSFEQLELLAAAHARIEARFVLKLAQAGAAKWDRDAWSSVQRKLIEETKTGL